MNGIKWREWKEVMIRIILAILWGFSICFFLMDDSQPSLFFAFILVIITLLFIASLVFKEYLKRKIIP